MKKNNLLKFIFALTTIIITISSFTSAVTIIPDTNKIGPGLPGKEYDDKIKVFATRFIGVLKWLGYAIAIGMLIYVGIKYLMAAADERASLKGLLVKVAIGSGIILCAEIIVNLVLKISESAT